MTTLAGCATAPNGAPGGPMGSIEQGFEHVATRVHDVFDSPDPCSNNDRNIGIAGGAVAGALLAHLMGKSGKALVAGSALGALAGGWIGHTMDARRCALYQIARRNKLELVSVPLTEQRLHPSAAHSGASHTIGLDVQLADKSDEFVPGTATLMPAARQYLGAIARQYTPRTMEQSLGAQATPAQRSEMANRQVLIVGHTDEMDDMRGVNLAELSQQRAKAVARVFAANGVPARNIFYQGAGDSLPLSSNATARGRADNNRVQIVDTPDVHTMTAFLQGRAADPRDFRSTRPTQSASSEPQHAATASVAPTPPSVAPASPGREARFARTPRATPPAAVAEAPAHVAQPASAGHLRVPRSMPVTADAQDIGLAGRPMETGYRIDLGAPATHSLFSLISSAHAAAPVVVGPCWKDHAHETTDVRNLATGQALSIRDALPGLYGEPWWSQQGNAAVALLHAYAPRDGGSPVPPTTVEFYARHPGVRHWHLTAKDASAPVNVYRGSRFTLYRVFLRERAQCVDLAVPNATASSHGYVIYERGGREYGAALQFTPRG